MSIDRFLILAEQGGFLDTTTATKLRAKISSHGQAVSAEEVSAWLVKRGLLTAFQAEKLMQATGVGDSSELGLASDSSDSEEDTFRLGPVRTSDTKKSLELLDDADDDRYTLLDARQTSPIRPDSPTDRQAVSHLRDDAGPPISLGGMEIGADDAANFPTANLQTTGWLRLIQSIFPRRPHRGQRWDSSLMLAGGGGLLALLIVGGFLYSVLAVGSGDEVFQVAEDDYNAQLYAQAIQKFDRFVQRYPKHGKVSLARVRMGLARMRTDVTARDWPKAMETVKRELELIRPEASFDAARSELAGILPEIFDGFVKRAAEVEDTDAQERLLDSGKEALALIENPDNLPASLRRQIQAKVDGIRDESEQIRREIARRRDVAKSIRDIQQAVAKSDSEAAYRFRDQLLERHPGAAKDTALQAALATISAVERDGVKVVHQPIVATQEERPASAYRAIPLVARRGQTADALANRVVAVNARGALYGLEGSTGQLLWRRWVGFETSLQPAYASSTPGADILIDDQRFGDLLCLNAKSGTLRWRVEVGRPAGVPVIMGDRLLQAGTEGTLFAVAQNDGTIDRRVIFPQKLSSPPAVDNANGIIFQAASHSTLYILDAKTLACTGTVYTGHIDGMVTVAPVVTSDLILLLENSGTDYCLLHVFVRKPGGVLVPAGEPIRLKGIVADAPLTFGRTVVVTTDRGAVYVMEAAADNLLEPLRIFAQVHPRTDSTASHFAQLSQNRIFIAGWGLAEFEILAARGTLERRWAEQVEDSHFVAPALFADTLVTARWSPLTSDVIVEAARLPELGKRLPDPIWQTRIAAEPVTPPIVMPDRSVLLAARNGAVWRIHRENVRSPVVESAATDMPAVGKLLITKAGDFVYTAGDDRPQWMFADHGTEQPKLVLLQDTTRRRLDNEPVLFADGMLLCSRKGPVFYVSPSTGQSLAGSIAWPASHGPASRWRTPAVSDGGFAIVASSDGIVQRLEVSSPENQLVFTKSVDLKSRIRANPVVAGPHVYLVARGNAQDTLLVLSCDSLQEVANFPLPQRAMESVYAMEDRVLLQTEEKMLVFQAAKPSWEAPLPHSLLAGAPTESAGRWLCATRNGQLFWIDPAAGVTGSTAKGQAAIEVGQALGASATIWGQTVLAAGHDGTLMLIPLTSESDAL